MTIFTKTTIFHFLRKIIIFYLWMSLQISLKNNFKNDINLLLVCLDSQLENFMMGVYNTFFFFLKWDWGSEE